MALAPAAASRWMPPKLRSSRHVDSPAYPAPAAVASCARGGGGSRSTRTPDGPSSSAGRWNRAWTHLLRLAVCLALLCCAAAAGAGPDLSAACMPAPSERTVAFRNTVVFNLGAGAVGDGVGTLAPLCRRCLRSPHSGPWRPGAAGTSRRGSLTTGLARHLRTGYRSDCLPARSGLVDRGLRCGIQRGGAARRTGPEHPAEIPCAPAEHSHVGCLEGVPATAAPNV
jgi:hypothetical protein